MPRPAVLPLGLHLGQTAKQVSRAFDAALAAAGGSLPTWLILISIKSRTLDNQRELAEVIGIQGATLTHHLNAMEADGLVTRRRDPTNRRIQRVELTESGEEAFRRMRQAAVSFDERLRQGLSEQDVGTFSSMLDRLRANVGEALPGSS